MGEAQTQRPSAKDANEALLEAASCGDIPALETALRAGADLKARDRIGRLATWNAAHAGQREALLALIAAGADIHDKEEGGAPPILGAAGSLRDAGASCMAELLREGADPDARCGRGITPAMAAACQGNVAILKQLIEAGADIQANDGVASSQVDAAMDAIHGSSPDCLRMLLQAGANLEARDARGRTLAMRAAGKHGTLSKPMLAMLMEAGADIHAKDDSGKTVCMHAASNREGEAMLRMMIQAGCDIEARDDRGRTAALHAAGDGRRECLLALAHAGADLDARDIHGENAADLAKEGDPDLSSLIQGLALAQREAKALSLASGAGLPAKPRPARI